MKKLLLLLCLYLACIPGSFAQLGKMQFEDAEEQFAAGRFGETLSLLEQSEKSLGGTNPMIAHLRIMARVELLKQDTEKYIDMLETAKEEAENFLKVYETETLIEEKYREVYKASKVLAAFPTKSDIEKKKAEEARKEAERLRLAKQSMLPGFIFGMTSAEAAKVLPNYAMTFPQDTLITLMSRDMKTMIFVSPKSSSAFAYVLFTHFPDPDEEFTAAKKDFEQKKEHITKVMGSSPVEETPAVPVASKTQILMAKRCIWTDGTRTVQLDIACQQYKRKNNASVTIMHSDSLYK
ncbi:MAG: hypothetical protein ACTHLD_10700 [Chitinophaga sp.]